MDKVYPPPSYNTPAHNKAAWYCRWLPCSTPQFLLPILFRSVLWSKRKAMKGEFTEADMVTASIRTAAYIEKSGGAIHLTGLDVLADNPGPFVFCGNHMSTLETFLLPSVITPYMPCSFVVKQSLLDHKLFGPIMRALKPIAVSREDPRQDLKAVMQEGKAQIQEENRSVFIFPQTTRTTDFKPSQFNTLGVKLAARAGVPVVPVAVKTDFWEPGKFLKDVGKVHPDRDVLIAFGEPMSVDNKDVKGVHLQVVDFIRSHLENWGVYCER